MSVSDVIDAETLYRRSYGKKTYLNPDGSATSRAFKPRPKDACKLSVDVKGLTTPQKSVVDKDKFVLFEISVPQVRELNLSVVHDPVYATAETTGNLAHALVYDIAEDDDIIPGQLARRSARVFL